MEKIHTLRFSIEVFDSGKVPQSNLWVVCKNKKGTPKQSFEQMTDMNGRVNFEFQSPEQSLEVEIEIKTDKFFFEIKDGDLINFVINKGHTSSFFLN